MAFERPQPTLDTHVPLKVHVPKEDVGATGGGRPDLPAPSIWQRSVKVKRKVDGKEAVVHVVDLPTMMFRAWYPDEGEVDPESGKPKGRFSERTEWEHCRNWDVEVTFSPKELERQAARRKLEDEMATLDPKELALVDVLCDDTDPTKALAKLEALRRAGIVSARPELAQAALEELRAGPGPKKGGR